MSELSDIARESLRTYVDEVGPGVAGLRAKLDGPLGMALINGMEASKEQAAANYELVNDFARLLPHLGEVKKGEGFTAKTQSEAMFLQSSVLWAPATLNFVRPGVSWLKTWPCPFYVLGHRRNEDTRSLFLVMAAKDQSGAKIRTTPTREGTVQIRTYPKGLVDAYEARVQQRLGRVYNAGELQYYSGLTGRFYDKQRGTFVITEGSPRSQSAYLHPLPELPQPSGILKAIRRARQPSLQPEMGQVEHYASLPPRVLVDFDVLGSMQALATHFGVLGRTDRLLANTPALK